jgi:hypothetical protein
MASSSSLASIGVGIDTARYGHRVSFLRPDRQPAAKALTVLENQQGYQDLRKRLELLHQQHPEAHFHIRIDAAGQYAANLECFLRSLPLPTAISVGEPKRNKDYQKRISPSAPPTTPRARPWRALPWSSNRKPLCHFLRP